MNADPTAAAGCVARLVGQAGARAMWRVACAVLPVVAAGGCVAPESSWQLSRARSGAAARPILEMDPNVNWTACFNRLLDCGEDAVEYLLSQPGMRRRAAPDDLGVMLHTSLLRLLARPGVAPPLTVNCLDTTLDLLHFEPKVRGEPLGEVCLPTPRPPARWHELYPARFDHELAGQIDVERDRKTMLNWWRAQLAGGRVEALLRRPLRPRTEHLWPLLARRRADLWTYEPTGPVYLCALAGPDVGLLRCETYDYNLVRAACIWLGSRNVPQVRRRLIELVASPVDVVSHNAIFALSFDSDPRVRELVRQRRWERRSGGRADGLICSRLGSAAASTVGRSADGLPARQTARRTTVEGS